VQGPSLASGDAQSLPLFQQFARSAGGLNASDQHPSQARSGLSDNAPLLVDAFLGPFEINFNRRKNSADVKVPVNLMHDRPQTIMKFVDCNLKLLEATRRKLQ
jgi:hypothetical protein